MDITRCLRPFCRIVDHAFDRACQPHVGLFEQVEEIVIALFAARLAQATESPARSVRTSAQVPSAPSSPPFWAIARPLSSVLGETRTVAADSGGCEESVTSVLKKTEERSLQWWQSGGF